MLDIRKSYRFGKKAAGGFTNPQYEAEHNEVIMGNNVQSTSGKDIASNLHQIVGKTHDEANPNTVNGTGEDVSGGDFVFSDRLSPDGKKSFAEFAAKLGKKKAKHEKNKDANDYVFKNTARIGLQQVDAQLAELAEIQELMKKQYGIMKWGGIPKFVVGGPVKPRTIEDLKADIANEEKNKIKKENEIKKRLAEKDVLNVKQKNKELLAKIKRIETDQKFVLNGRSAKVGLGFSKPSAKDLMTEYNELELKKQKLTAKPVLKKDPIRAESLNKVTIKTDDKSLDKVKDKSLDKVIIKTGDKTKNKITTKDKTSNIDETITKTKIRKSVPRVATTPLKPEEKVVTDYSKLPIRAIPTIQRPTFKSETPRKEAIEKVDTNNLFREVPVEKEKRDYTDLAQAGMIGANYLANRNIAKRMNTSVPAIQLQGEQYQYNDMSEGSRNQIRSSVNNELFNPYATKASRINAYSKGMEMMNSINQQELNHKFNYDAQIRSRNTQIENQNATMINQAVQEQNANENDRLSMESDNNNALFTNIGTFVAQNEQRKAKLKGIALLANQLKDKGLSKKVIDKKLNL